MKIASVAVLLVGLYSCLCQQIVGLNAFDITKMMSDEEYVHRQLNCILDKGVCDKVGSQLKAAMPEVMSRNCNACTPQQAAIAKYIMKQFRDRYPDEWRKIQKKYPPDLRYYRHKKFHNANYFETD